MKTVSIPSNYIGDFKVGDNLVHNADLLCKLTELGSHYNKLIVVQTGSITEAALSQIFYRAKNYTKEGVPNIPEKDLAEIANKKVDSFNNIIDVSKKHHLLDELGADIYSELHNLREYRNKVHIQLDVTIEGLNISRNETEAFSDEIRSWAFALNNKILEFLGKKYPRPKGLDTYVAPLTVPA